MLNGSKSADDDWSFTEDWPQSRCSYIRHFISPGSIGADGKIIHQAGIFIKQLQECAACNVYICKLNISVVFILI